MTSFYLNMSCFCYIIKQRINIIIKKEVSSLGRGREGTHVPPTPLGYVPFSELLFYFMSYTIRLWEQPWWQLPLPVSKTLLTWGEAPLFWRQTAFCTEKYGLVSTLHAGISTHLPARRSCCQCGVGLNAGNTEYRQKKTSNRPWNGLGKCGSVFA